jgi:hypothetical protein
MPAERPRREWRARLKAKDPFIQDVLAEPKIYRVARRFTVRAQSGFETSVDAIWTWRWQ